RSQDARGIHAESIEQAACHIAATRFRRVARAARRARAPGPGYPDLLSSQAMARAPWVVALLLALAPAARADMEYVPQAPPPAPDRDFWRDIVTPHADEIADILAKANQAYSYAYQCGYQDCDATGEQRQQTLDDLYYMLRYARKLDPNQQDVLLMLGKVAEESGRPAAAIEALE